MILSTKSGIFSFCTRFFTIGFFVLSSCMGEAQKKPEVLFRKIVLTNDFVAEGVAAGDVNRDGRRDIMAGAFWFEAPNWTRHEIAKGLIFFPDTAYSNSFLSFSSDVNQDGWVDLIRVGFPGKEVVWYANPQSKSGFWDMHTIYNTIGNESPALADVNGDGRPDILCNDPVSKQVIWLQAPSVKGDTLWQRFVISKKQGLGTDIYTHGLGWGDINRDGRPDVIITKGWWERPGDITKEEWIFHPADLGEGCSQLYTFDVDGDGDADVLSSSAHHYGIWWHEQQKDAGGNIKFKEHEISKAFSQTHGLAMADINGDGHPDLVTGKRYFAHNGKDPGAFDPAVLYWFEYLPGKSPEWIPHQIDDNSGVGLQVVVNDMNRDGFPDIVVANKKGVFLFERIDAAVSRKARQGAKDAKRD